MTNFEISSPAMISKALDIKTFKYKKIKDWVNTRIVSKWWSLDTDFLTHAQVLNILWYAWKSLGEGSEAMTSGPRIGSQFINDYNLVELVCWMRPQFCLLVYTSLHILEVQFVLPNRLTEQKCCSEISRGYSRDSWKEDGYGHYNLAW